MRQELVSSADPRHREEFGPSASRRRRSDDGGNIREPMTCTPPSSSMDTTGCTSSDLIPTARPLRGDLTRRERTSVRVSSSA